MSISQYTVGWASPHVTDEDIKCGNNSPVLLHKFLLLLFSAVHKTISFSNTLMWEYMAGDHIVSSGQ